MKPDKLLGRLGSVSAIPQMVIGICSVALLVIRLLGNRIAAVLMEIRGHAWYIPLSSTGRPICSVRAQRGEAPQCGYLRESVRFADIIATTAMTLAVVGFALLFVLGFIRLLRSAQGSVAAGRKYHVVRAPGYRLHRLAQLIYSRKTMVRVFDPMLKDMQGEYFQALSKGELSEARKIHVHYWWDFVRATVWDGLSGLVKDAVGFWKLPK